MKMGLHLGISQRGVGVAFTPRSLFANGEGGAWYDSSDLTTMRQNRGGSTDAAVGDPVGVILDTSQGGLDALGAELLGSGVVSLVGTATAATYNTSTGEGSVSRVDLTNQSYIQWSSLTGSIYRMQLTCTSGTILIRQVSFSGLAIHSISAGSTVDVIMRPSSGGIALTNITSAGTATFTVSMFREVFGNHAFAPSDAARPLLNDVPYLLNHDGVDDQLAVTLPDLGTDATVATLVGDTWTISTGQTIGAGSRNLPTSDWRQHIIIDRALTAGETAALEAWLPAA